MVMLSPVRGLRPWRAARDRVEKGKTLTLTLAAADAPRHDETVTLLYVRPDPPAKPLQDLSGNKVVFIGAGTGGRVTNNTPPAFESASVDADGDTLTIEFDGDLDTAAAPSAVAFTVTINGEDQTPAGVAFKTGAADEVELSLDPAVARGQQTVTVGYRRRAPGRWSGRDHSRRIHTAPRELSGLLPDGQQGLPTEGRDSFSGWRRSRFRG